jgi:hypothetical protein
LLLGTGYLGKDFQAFGNALAHFHVGEGQQALFEEYGGPFVFTLPQANVAKAAGAGGRTEPVPSQFQEREAFGQMPGGADVVALTQCEVAQAVQNEGDAVAVACFAGQGEGFIEAGLAAGRISKVAGQEAEANKRDYDARLVAEGLPRPKALGHAAAGGLYVAPEASHHARSLERPGPRRQQVRPHGFGEGGLEPGPTLREVPAHNPEPLEGSNETQRGLEVAALLGPAQRSAKVVVVG